MDQTNQQLLNTKEISALREQIKDQLKLNEALKGKVEKFSEAAMETTALKEKTTLLKTHLKEATMELDIVATKYKEE